MPKPKPVFVWLGVGLVLLAAMLTWGVIALRKMAGAAGTGGPSAVQLTVANLNTLPADVRDAADRLRSSKVGYAMTRGNKTYLIISTGQDSLTVRYDHALRVANKGVPTLVDVHLSRDVSGSRLLVLQANKDPKTDAADYQFDVDTEPAAIPTLHNPHNLPLVALPSDARFVVLDPVRGQVADQFPLQFSGYARVSDGQFTVTLLSSSGKELAKAYVKAAAGAPGWGSFVGDLRPTVTEFPDAGTIVFQGDDPAARLVIPVRFHADTNPELG